MKYAALKCANGPCTQSMSFLDGHGVPLASPTVHLAPIVSGSAVLLSTRQARGSDALRNVLRALTDIKGSH